MALTPASQQVIKKIRSLVQPEQTLVFIAGNFNILHPGHMRLFDFAADCGDVLVVALNPDSTPGVMFPQSVRAEGVSALSKVNHVVQLDGPLSEFLGELKPDIVVKGKEHEKKTNPEAEVIKSYGGKLLFSSGERKYTSLDLLTKEYENISYSNVVQPHVFLDRHKISLPRLSDLLSKMKKMNILVIGDVIVDEYITCDALGLSQEDPTIVVTPILNKKFIGGAGIVASHARGFGHNVKFFSVVGDDETGQFAADCLKKYQVDARLFPDESRPTSLKQRFRTKDKTLLRVSHLRQHSISEELLETVYQAITKQIDGIDLMVFSDFNYGCLPQKLVDRLTQLCQSKNIKMVADSQSSSQVGDITRFKNMELITPTEREARLGVRDFESGLVVLTEKLREAATAKHIFITMGAEGVLVVDANGSTDQLSPLNPSPKDVAGAGDSMLVCSSMALACGANIWEAAYLGSIAAACQVGRVGNFPLNTDDIVKEIQV